MQEQLYWQSVVERDSTQDGEFVYAVRSTGIYCRPSCPSRRPSRDQVLFFAQPLAAEKAGFRPCLRCRPNETMPADHMLEPVRQACGYIESNLDRPLTLQELSAVVGLSPYHLQRTFKRVMGITPRQYADACRLGEFKEQVRDGDSVTGALYGAGYGSSSRLYERAPGRLGMTPATYRDGGSGVQIGYAIVGCPLGRLLVAATERGVCAVTLGDNDSDLESALKREYPGAELFHGGPDLERWVGEIVAYLEGRHPQLDLPLDMGAIRATAFQWRVWDALRAIPYGSTRSYSEIAQAIGDPNAARAVARACATNRVALVIPCHRVVGQGGKLAGYRWGVERKQLLLEGEAAALQRQRVGAGEEKSAAAV